MLSVRPGVSLCADARTQAVQAENAGACAMGAELKENGRAFAQPSRVAPSAVQRSNLPRAARSASAEGEAGTAGAEARGARRVDAAAGGCVPRDASRRARDDAR